MPTIALGLDGLTIAELVAVAREYARIEITPQAQKEIGRARKFIEKCVQDGETIYGITTGFGQLSDVAISAKDTLQLQRNLLMSHACGVGQPLDEEAVRAIFTLRIKDLARGNSSARLELVQRLVDILNHHITPVIPEKGSVGASGDLCPLAHLSLVLIGLGEAFYENRRISGAEALAQCGLEAMDLESGEGLALINGTQVMTGIGALAVFDARNLAKMTDVAAAMSLEVLMGSRAEFDPQIHHSRPHPGQALAADNMLRITQSSEIISSHHDCERVQDAYTLRCSPQVHGASHDAIRYAANVVETEMNSSTGNPLIFHESGQFLTGGNFHGQPVALAMDFMSMAVAELANISERRVERLVNPMLSGLPAFLIKDGGLNSGFMIAQYTAASLVSENKVLSHPACVDSIPTSANKEDHVSMGTIAARKCREIVRNTEDVIAIELLCAAQALDLFTNMKPGEGTLAAYELIRSKIGHMDRDRVLSHDIAAMRALLHSGDILRAVESKVGRLH
jgi:histidine ammonia-lyase